MDFTKKTAVTWIALTLTGFPLIAGCAGPRWTGLSDIKRKEMAPEHDTVRITSQPSGARVFVQEKLVGLTPLRVELSFRRVKKTRPWYGVHTGILRYQNIQTWIQGTFP
jgi:hypothetical protein